MAIRSRAWVFFAALIVGPFLYGYWTHQTVIVPESSERNDHLATDAAKLDFGEQPPQKEFTWSLSLTNTTDKELEILDFELGCLCSKVAPRAFSIAPKDTIHVTVTLDLEPRNDDELATQVREFAASIKPSPFSRVDGLSSKNGYSPAES